MNGHERRHRLPAAFLAGELSPANARRWDEHLLECEACWRAVREDRAGRQAAQLLRRPAPPDLADRVAFAIELAAPGTTAPRRPHRRLGLRRRLAGAGALALAAAVTATVLLFPAGHKGAVLPAAVGAVAIYAQTMPPPAGEQAPGAGQNVAPVEVGRPVTQTAGGQRIVLRTWRLGGVEAVVATSSRPFPVPPGAQAVAGGGMAWSARMGKLGLYCLNGRTSELVAAPVPAAELAALAARLPLA